ncbi:MAG TPA: hypothetical protein VIO33_20795 [Burkholderiaceae bacterium]
MDTSPTASHLTYELRFESLFRPGRGYTFPCDAAGQVDLRALTERERHGYLRAQSLVGRELATPALMRRSLQ